MVDWTTLPVELLRMIAIRSFSTVELKRFRSVCKTWRYSVSGTDTPIKSRTLIKLNPLAISVSNNLPHGGGGIQQSFGLDLPMFLSRASFFRITPSSSSSKGWLIKSDVDINLGKVHLVSPLSRLPLRLWSESLNLWEFTVTEIQESYLVLHTHTKKADYGFEKVILIGGHRVMGVGVDGKIRYWNGENWIRIKDQVGHFFDIIVYNGLTYALDSRGIIWWISSSLNIFRYGPSLDENDAKDCSRDMSLVGCCGELYIVDRCNEDNARKRKLDSLYDDVLVNHVPRYSTVIHDDAGNKRCEILDIDNSKTVGFKVYKMDEEIGKWVETKSLEGYAFVMATDTSFSILAHEFYGCLPNSIYFTDGKEEDVKVFKLEDGSISTVLKLSDSSLKMFVPSFL